MADKASFYVLTTETGKENRCRTEFLRKCAIEDLKPKYVKRAFIPKHKELRTMPDGKPKTVNAKSFPGYLIIEMVWDYRVFDVLKRIPFSWGLLPHRPENPNIKNYSKLTPTEEEKLHAYESWLPRALESEEAALLTLQHKEMSKKVKPVCNYEIGDRLTIDHKANSYNKCKGIVQALKLSKGEITLILKVKILGVLLDVEVPFWQCRKSERHEE